MQQLPYRSSLLTRVVGALVTVTALVVGLTVGLALFLVILGLGAIAIAVFYARVYWLRRKLMQRMQNAQRSSAQAHRTIEGEYRVERPPRQRR